MNEEIKDFYVIVEDPDGKLAKGKLEAKMGDNYIVSLPFSPKNTLIVYPKSKVYLDAGYLALCDPADLKYII